MKNNLKSIGGGQNTTAISRVKTLLHGKVARLELYVADQPRPEGPLGQLVRVRFKGGSRSGRPRNT